MRASIALLALVIAPTLPAQGTPVPQLKVKELTAFKDGHAFVLRSGDAVLGKDGRVRLDDLPAPVLGTFWPAVLGNGATLRSVTASRRRVTFDRTALDLRQLVAANVGADVVVHETGDVRYQAKILGIPARAPDEVSAAATPPGGPALSERADLVLLRTEAARKDQSNDRIADAGTRVVRLDRIVDLTFLAEPKGRFVDEQIKSQLLLEVDTKGQTPATVPVALTWMERGFRSIPSYRIVIDGKGSAALRLQATLVNDLVDLDDSIVHLVVGVPSFLAKGAIDPISLQGTAAAIAASVGPSQTQYFTSNAMMTQAVSSQMGGYSQPAAAADTGGDLADGKKEEDLFVFTLRGITLERHERMVVTVGEFAAPYKDVWRLDVPITPPQEMLEQMRTPNTELARLLTAPKVQHRIRLDNQGKVPFTTAPALVLWGERVLAQGMMTYTPSGQSCDLGLTTAVDLLVKKLDRETGRAINAVRWNGVACTRVDVEGTLTIRNRRGSAVEVEVQRYVVGKLTSVTAGGTQSQVNIHEDSSFLPEGSSERSPSYYWGWPQWWHDLNGVGRASWTVKIEPGTEVQVGCAWQYAWR